MLSAAGGRPRSAGFVTRYGVEFQSTDAASLTSNAIIHESRGSRSPFWQILPPPLLFEGTEFRDHT
jgi:hypothetical protein